MKRTAWLAVLVLGAHPARAGAWGHAGHQLVVTHAAAVTPGPLGRLARADVGRLRLRSLDPDVAWRDDCGDEERVQHFFDADVYAQDPAAIPREQAVLESAYGVEEVARNGLLPWRIEELGLCLEEALAAGQLDLAIDLMGQLGHYTADLAQPLHLTKDYDGQSTGQRGIHRRYERELVASALDRLALALDRHRFAVVPIADPVTAAFEVMPGTGERVARILAVDRRASRHGHATPAYFGEMLERLEPSLIEQLIRAIDLTAGVWLGAWERAGSPSLLTTEEEE